MEEVTPGSAPVSKASLDGVGTVTVKVDRSVVISRNAQHRSDPIGLGKIKEIPEKKLKGMSLTHSAKYTLICHLDCPPRPKPSIDDRANSFPVGSGQEHRQVPNQ